MSHSILLRRTLGHYVNKLSDLWRSWVHAGILYLVHDHVQKYDDASEDAFYHDKEFIAPAESSFGIT